MNWQVFGMFFMIFAVSCIASSPFWVGVWLSWKQANIREKKRARKKEKKRLKHLAPG